MATRWNIMFDIVPQTGYRILMDGFPGVIASDDDFGVNSGGIMITETTMATFTAGIQTARLSSSALEKRCNTPTRLMNT